MELRLRITFIIVFAQMLNRRQRGIHTQHRVSLRATGACFVASIMSGLLLSCAASAGSSEGRVRVVGSFYPLAWAAGAIGGNRVQVLDLTPPGVEAHDTSLSARQVAEVEGADVVLLLGYLGFQPQVEAAARHAKGRVVLVTRGMNLHSSQEPGLSADPHVWLDPALMERIVGTISDALIEADPPGRSAYEARARTVLQDLSALDASYRSALKDCAFTTFVTTHEAFGYLADQYHLHQVGIEGLTPEAEPGAAQLRMAEAVIAQGKAAPAVFFEGTSEGERIGRSVAASVGVSALPLGTLEFDPEPQNYVSVMRANLDSLKEGMQCH
jgi:zinc transport system substrate-binding protein